MKSNLALVIALVWAVSASAITIETVPVGDVGNANDPATRNFFGRVDYVYNIGKSEVTVGQHTAFLNAVAATDTYSLYNPAMATDLNIAGIAQSGAPGSYTYSVIGSANHPVTYVSWGDAARFANWLHNGQPTGGQNSTTTEDGAYKLVYSPSPFTNSINLMAVTRNTGAQWVIPSESEWYKAAYYQPVEQGGDSDNYWKYPMRTNSAPYSDQPPGATPDNTRVGNFYNWVSQGGFGFGQSDTVASLDAVGGYDNGYAVTDSQSRSASQNYLTDVGAYASSPSYYGTFDQGGNVYEWTEQKDSSTDRNVRGSSWNFSIDALSSANRSSSNPTSEGPAVGFRVASIPTPEPSTLLLTITAFATLLIRRRKSVPHNRGQ